MNEQHQQSGLSSIIIRAGKLNAAMALYFLMPNFLSFVGVLIICSEFICGNCCKESLGQNCEVKNEQQGVLSCLNSRFEEFTNAKLSLQLITLILLGFVIQLLDLFPNWLVVLIAVELYAFRPLLANVIEMGKGYLEKGSNAIELLLERIPRYQA